VIFLLECFPLFIHAGALKSPGERNLGLGNPGGGLDGMFRWKLASVCVCLLPRLLC
jgi:hypothetical protein